MAWLMVSGLADADGPNAAAAGGASVISWRMRKDDEKVEDGEVAGGGV